MITIIKCAPDVHHATEIVIYETRPSQIVIAVNRGARCIARIIIPPNIEPGPLTDIVLGEPQPDRPA